METEVRFQNKFSESMPSIVGTERLYLQSFTITNYITLLFLKVKVA